LEFKSLFGVAVATTPRGALHAALLTSASGLPMAPYSARTEIIIFAVIDIWRMLVPARRQFQPSTCRDALMPWRHGCLRTAMAVID